MDRVMPLLLILLLSAAGCSRQESDAPDNAVVNCAINTGSCSRRIDAEDLRITFDISPKPVAPMKELQFSVTLRENEGPVTDADVTMDLSMPGMFMGVNRPVLSHTEEGRYEGTGIIPVCSRGEKVWKAVIMIDRNGGTASVRYVFEVE